MPTKRNRVAHLPVIEPNAAGIDIGATQIFVAVPGDRDPAPVRCFQTFTVELEKLANWLQECRIRTVAMESTGVYWIPLFQILEARGLPGPRSPIRSLVFRSPLDQLNNGLAQSIYREWLLDFQLLQEKHPLRRNGTGGN